MQSPAAIPACDPSAVSRMGPRSHGTGSGVLSQKIEFGRSLSKIEFGRSLSKIEFTLAFTREIIRAIMDPLRSAIPKCLSQRGRRDLKHPSNSQLRPLCHGLLYYGGHAVVTWLKGAGGHCMTRQEVRKEIRSRCTSPIVRQVDEFVGDTTSCTC